MPNTAQAIKTQNKPSSREISAAGLRAFFNIARDWELNTDEQMVLLGGPGRSTFFKWKSATSALTGHWGLAPARPATITPQQ